MASAWWTPREGEVSLQLTPGWGHSAGVGQRGPVQAASTPPQTKNSTGGEDTDRRRKPCCQPASAKMRPTATTPGKVKVETGVRMERR